MRALAFTGALLAILCAGLAGWQITKSFNGFLIFAAPLGWAWHTRASVPGVQGRTTLAACVAAGVLGFADTFVDVAATTVATDRDAARLLVMIGVAFMLPAIGVFVWATRTLALAKGRSGWLGLLGIFHVLGYGFVVALLPARKSTPVAEIAG